MTWKASGEPKTVGEATVQYLRSTHFQEGAWDVVIGPRTVRVLPDGQTSGTKRSRAILSDLAATYAAQEAWDLSADAVEHGRGFVDPVAYLVGRLVLDGCTTIEVDGAPLIPASGQWHVTLADHGQVTATYVGGGR